MTLFQLSYLLLWLIAILFLPVSAVLLYLVVNLRNQVIRESESGIAGHWLIGRSIADLPCESLAAPENRRLQDVLSTRNVVMTLSPSCGSCRAMLDELLSLSRDDFGGLTFVGLCMGDVESCKSMVSSRKSPVALLAYPNWNDKEIYMISFPAALMVDEAGVIVDLRHPQSIKGLIKTLRLEVYDAPKSEKASTSRSRSSIRTAGFESVG